MGQIKINGELYGSDNSLDLKYDNTESGLEATNIKDAIDEINEKVGIDASEATLNQIPTADGEGGWSWEDQQGGTAIEKIEDIGDVELTDIEDGQALVWDAESEKWINKLIEGGGSSGNSYDITTLYSIEDGDSLPSVGTTVEISDISNYDELIFGSVNQSDYNNQTFGVTKGVTYNYIPVSTFQTNKNLFLTSYDRRYCNILYIDDTHVQLARSGAEGESSDHNLTFGFIYGIKYKGGGGSGNRMELTKAEYDALTEEEQKNGTVYYVTDEDSSSDGKTYVEIQSSIYTTETTKVTASSYLNDNFAPYMAFNGVSATISTCQQGWLASDSDETPWIKYEFNGQIIPTSIKFEFCNNASEMSRILTIYGSADDDEYDSLGTISVTFKNSQYSNYLFTINTDKAYKYIKIQSNDKLYLGVNQSAGTFSEVTINGKFIASGEVYSRDEIKVGTWIDGKPIYRKTYTNFKNGSILDSTLNSTNIMLINAQGSFLASTGNVIPVGYYAVVVINSNNIWVDASYSATAYDINNITIEYVKLTD